MKDPVMKAYMTRLTESTSDIAAPIPSTNSALNRMLESGNDEHREIALGHHELSQKYMTHIMKHGSKHDKIAVLNNPRSSKKHIDLGYEDEDSEVSLAAEEARGNVRNGYRNVGEW